MANFNSEQKEITRFVFNESNAGNIHFGEVIQYLLPIGIESYYVDYRCGETTYFLSNGKSLRYYFFSDISKIKKEFDDQKIKLAIHQAQSGSIMYPEFKAYTYAAGCIGYIVWITGQKIQYFGRLGEIHCETFPPHY